jgi:hypothetical protein
MKKNEKYDQEMKNESTHRNENQIVPYKPKQSRLKKTVVTSAVSLALLGASQIPMQALLGGAEPSVQAQTRARNQDDRALNAYFGKGFNYVDAKILAAYWGGNIGDAKVRMGHKLLNLTQKQALGFIREARGLALERSSVYSQSGYGSMNFPINYGDGGYQYEDAEALSSFWKKDLGDTKFLMETMLISGKDKDIQAALRVAKRR